MTVVGIVGALVEISAGDAGTSAAARACARERSGDVGAGRTDVAVVRARALVNISACDTAPRKSEGASARKRSRSVIADAVDATIVNSARALVDIVADDCAVTSVTHIADAVAVGIEVASSAECAVSVETVPTGARKASHGIRAGCICVTIVGRAAAALVQV
jgi:hypothetical protein